MKAKTARNNLILFAVLLVAAIVFYIFIIPTQIYMSALAKAEAFSPDTFPRAVTVIFIISAALGLIGSLVQYVRAVKVEGKPVKEKKKITKDSIYATFIPYIVFALSLIYAICFKEIGVIWATLIVPPIILLAMKCRKWNYYAILYAFCAVLYVIFKLVLMVPLH